MAITWKYAIAYQHDNPMYKPISLGPDKNGQDQKVPVMVMATGEYNTAEEAAAVLDNPTTYSIYENPVIIKLEYIT